VKFLNCVVYEHILIERITEEVKRILIAVNVSRVFIQSLTLILLYFIKIVKTSLLNRVAIRSGQAQILELNLTHQTLLCNSI